MRVYIRESVPGVLMPPGEITIVLTQLRAEKLYIAIANKDKAPGEKTKKNVKDPTSTP